MNDERDDWAAIDTRLEELSSDANWARELPDHVEEWNELMFELTHATRIEAIRAAELADMQKMAAAWRALHPAA